jgi:hypothetical protein
MSSGTIAAIIVSIVLMILFVLVFLFIMNRRQKVKTPFEIWTDHYETQKTRSPTQIPHINTQTSPDIHHFYNKSPTPRQRLSISPQRLSISPNTAFSPYVATQQRNSQRNSAQFRHATTKFDL